MPQPHSDAAASHGSLEPRLNSLRQGGKPTPVALAACPAPAPPPVWNAARLSQGTPPPPPRVRPGDAMPRPPADARPRYSPHRRDSLRDSESHGVGPHSLVISAARERRNWRNVDGAPTALYRNTVLVNNCRPDNAVYRTTHAGIFIWNNRCANRNGRILGSRW